MLSSAQRSICHHRFLPSRPVMVEEGWGKQHADQPSFPTRTSDDQEWVEKNGVNITAAAFYQVSIAPIKSPFMM